MFIEVVLDHVIIFLEPVQIELSNSIFKRVFNTYEVLFMKWNSSNRIQELSTIELELELACLSLRFLTYGEL